MVFRMASGIQVDLNVVGSLTRPLGGPAQPVESLPARAPATPVSPIVAALPQDVQGVLFARLRHELAPLESDGKIIGETTSNIIVANH
jgi:hypothetical protein